MSAPVLFVRVDRVVGGNFILKNGELAGLATVGLGGNPAGSVRRGPGSESFHPQHHFLPPREDSLKSYKLIMK